MSDKPPLKAPVLLNKSHGVERFDCGSESLDTYLKRFAFINNQNGSARTYVALRGNEVVGYYTLTPGSVERDQVAERVGQGLARHPIPIILLARLAVDRTEQKIGLGKGLLRDALIRVVSAADIIGGRALLVYAKDENAKAFYEHFSFESSPVDSFHLFLLLKDIRKTLGV
ncbi:MAG: GNAT family N-acetyltransferase [Candidatus Omnitrophica bacterium]|nr:GNAT family N-acetyltransferase [Candidatus Omnitrophota bacterium]